jgi:restriction system protein
MSSTYWVVRPNPDHTDRMEEFLQEDIIAIGWPHLPALDELAGDQLFAKLQTSSPTASKRTLKMQQNMIIRFSMQMGPGDLVVVPYGKLIYFARITGDYHYSRHSIKDGYPHQRKVQWLLEKKGFPRAQLDTTLRGALRPQLALYSLEDYGPRLEELLARLESPAQRPEPQVEVPEEKPTGGAVINKELVNTARQALLETLRSEDPSVRLRAVQIILEHYQAPRGRKLKTGS